MCWRKGTREPSGARDDNSSVLFGRRFFAGHPAYAALRRGSWDKPSTFLMAPKIVAAAPNPASASHQKKLGQGTLSVKIPTKGFDARPPSAVRCDASDGALFCSSAGCVYDGRG